MAFRLFGVFFLLSFLSYGVGMGLTESAQQIQSSPANILSKKNQIVTGGILSILFHAFFNLACLSIMFSALKAVSRVQGYLYFSLGAIATFILAIGALFLLLPISFSEYYIQSSSKDFPVFKVILKCCMDANFHAYQLGMAFWGSGGLFFCYLLYQSKLVPKFFPYFGFVGYPIFIAGTILELFGYPVGTWLSIPGGLFEISLSFWLIVKGAF